MTETTHTHKVTLNDLFSVEVDAPNFFQAAATAVALTKVEAVETIKVWSFLGRHGITFDEGNFHRLADELFRASPFAETFEVEDTDRDGFVFFYIDEESNVLEVTLDGQVVPQTEAL